MPNIEVPPSQPQGSPPSGRPPRPATTAAGQPFRGPRSVPNRGRKLLKLALTTFALVFAVFVGFVLSSPSLRRIIGGHWSDIASGAMHGNALRLWTPDRQYPGKSSIIVLIMGSDHDYDNKDQIIKNAPGRSDSMMLARIDFARKTIDGVTIPRDSAVHIPNHKGTHKINAAHEYGGPELSLATVQQTLGVTPDAYLDLNLEGFVSIVDALGGVELNVDKVLNYDDNWGNLHIHLKPGLQHLSGYNAMGYVRARHSDSDLMRSKRQHEFLEALRQRITTPSNFVRLPAAADKLQDSIKRSPGFTEDQMYALANFARGLPKENIHFATLPSIEGKSFVTIEPVKSAELIKRMLLPDQTVVLNLNVADPYSILPTDAPTPRIHKRKRVRRAAHGAKGAFTPHAPVDLSVPDAPAGPSTPTQSQGPAPSGGAFTFNRHVRVA